ncbi:gcl [Trypoxylus dichotomus]
MGSAISTNALPYRIVCNVSNFVRGTKRKLSDRDAQEDVEKVIEIAMHTPKRKKVESTAQYIYQALFKEEPLLCKHVRWKLVGDQEEFYYNRYYRSFNNCKFFKNSIWFFIL